MSLSWNWEIATMSNSLWRFRLLNQDPLRKHVPRRFLQKDENEGWDLYENLAERTIQWEPTNENSKNSSSISSKGGLHSIESSITAEAKIANLARRVEVLKTKESSSVNQFSPNHFQLRAVLTVKPWIMCLRSILCFKLNNTFQNRWMRPFQGLTIILTTNVQSWLEKSSEFLMEPK